MTLLDILRAYRFAFATGLLTTLQLTLLVWCVGIILGFALGVAGATRHASVGRAVSVGSFLLGGLPLLVLLFWLHYPLQAMLDVVINPFVTAAFALSLVNTFAVAQLVRSALNDFPDQYTVAARVAGLDARQTLLHIKVPILLRQILPSLLTSQVTMLQATLFASLISVEEIFRVAQRVNAIIYRPIQIYSALGIFFLIICLPLNGAAMWLKARYTRKFSEA